MKNNFSLSVATVNGSGSQSANNIIARSLFRMGFPVGAKNLFPSNISGLPTWFNIRVNENGFCGRKLQHEIVIAKNSETLDQDIRSVAPGGYIFYDTDFKVRPETSRTDITLVPLPYRDLVQNLSDSIKMRKLLTNMVYVGVLAELLKINSEILIAVTRSQFQNKESVVQPNLQSLEAGKRYAEENLQKLNFPYLTGKETTNNKNKLLIDGNSAAALGALVGGCTTLSWYPITPSSSLAENFHDFANALRKDELGHNKFAVIQAEDELSAINMVLGAGWAGSRAMTATSGPGLSLMAEAAGLSYFAEIPAVIWDVQRAGPSTGLPTRTMQCDLQFAANLSHGDTEHIVLLPANPKECFDFAQIAFDLAEEFQTLVVVLSDLDIGMNFSISETLEISGLPLQRGKVLSASDLNSQDSFARYQDVDGDGVCYRTLPGTMHTNAAYFTRGTAHNENSNYTEDSEIFRKLLTRLKKKLNTASAKLPKAIQVSHNNKNLLVGYGSTDFVIPELQSMLKQKGIGTDYLRIRALPLTEDLNSTLEHYDNIYVIEQNRDGQMRNLMLQKFTSHSKKIKSLTSFDGLPLAAEFLYSELLNQKNVVTDEK